MEYEKVINTMAEFFEGEYFNAGQVVSKDKVRGEKQDPFGPFKQVYVNQGGGGMSGDDFHGVAYFGIGKGRFASAEY
jgi:hypothetical protein